MRPVLLLILSPGGNPAALYERVRPPVSVAWIWSETVLPRTVVWLPGFVKTTNGLTVQVNAWLVLRAPSEAATVTWYGIEVVAPAARVPEIRPVPVLRLSP